MNMMTPPNRIAPGLAARLTGRKTAYLGTLFDLARRGILCIEDYPRRQAAPTIHVIHHSVGGKLSLHEQVFVQTVLARARDNRIALDEISPLAQDMAYGQALDEELGALGWLKRQPAGQRSQFLASVMTGLDSVLCTRTLLGIVWGSAITRSLSDEGMRQAAAWNRFANYLRDITRGREPAHPPNTFGRYLPYAAAFGFAAQWNDYFNQLEQLAISSWLQALQAGQDRDRILPAILAAEAATAEA